MGTQGRLDTEPSGHVAIETQSRLDTEPSRRRAICTQNGMGRCGNTMHAGLPTHERLSPHTSGAVYSIDHIKTQVRASKCSCSPAHQDDQRSASREDHPMTQSQSQKCQMPDESEPQDPRESAAVETFLQSLV